jgi:hypothetical protein
MLKKKQTKEKKTKLAPRSGVSRLNYLVKSITLQKALVANFLMPSGLSLLFLSVGGHYFVYLTTKLYSLSWRWKVFLGATMVRMSDLIENGKGRWYLLEMRVRFEPE